MNFQQYSGLVVPTITPFTSDEKIDEKSLRKLIGFLISEGVHGLWIAGTSGEFSAIEDSERLKSLEIAIDETKKRVPIIFNISATSTNLAINLAEKVKLLEIQGIALTPPYYFNSPQNELLEHYRKINAVCPNIPLWIYNIPQTVKTVVSVETVIQLAKEGVVQGIKDSSGDGEYFSQIVTSCHLNNIKLNKFLGTHHRIDTASKVGADGIIPGTGNAIPKIIVNAWDSSISNEVSSLNSAIKKISVFSGFTKFAVGKGRTQANLGIIKATLEFKGIIENSSLSAPLESLTDQEKMHLEKALKENDLI